MILDAINELSYYRLGYIMKTFVKIAFTIIPIIIIIKCMIDLFKVVTNPDEAKNTPKTIARRFISGLIIYLLPVITDYGFKTLTDYNDDLIVKYYEGASIEKIKQYEELVKKEREDAINERIKKSKEAALKQAEERKKLAAQGKKLKKDRPDASGSSTTGGGGTPSNYDVTSDTKYDNYQVKASCESQTLKYKVLVVNGEYYTIIWAANPYEQMNLALAAPNSFGRLTGDRILNNEISSNGYQNKCLVAVNASFFSYSTNSPISGVVISKGQVVKNDGDSGGVIGISSDGELKQYVHQTADAIAADGVRNTFTISSSISVDMGTGGQTAGRTQIFQIDNNNYVLYTGSGTVGGCVQKVNQVTGATNGFNLDGGGSRKLYYQTSGQSSVTSIMEGGRPIPDMLYFVEQ